MPRLLVATYNPGKLREIERVLGEDRFELLSLADLSEAAEIEEDGDTFEANAVRKAVGYSLLTDDLTLADDSGLEVEALGRAPGVQSARYGGPGLDDQARTALVLRQMAGVPEERRQARFVCVIALARHGGLVKTFQGTVEGILAFEPRGTEGFGYDPIFYYPPKARTFGELPRDEKDAVSHRGRALRALLDSI
jgi:XTP/dITP diphosphohydrolase